MRPSDTPARQTLPILAQAPSQPSCPYKRQSRKGSPGRPSPDGSPCEKRAHLAVGPWAVGSPGRIRTCDTLINSQLRYHCATGEWFSALETITDLTDCATQKIRRFRDRGAFTHRRRRPKSRSTPVMRPHRAPGRAWGRSPHAPGRMTHRKGAALDLAGDLLDGTRAVIRDGVEDEAIDTHDLYSNRCSFEHSKT